MGCGIFPIQILPFETSRNHLVRCRGAFSPGSKSQQCPAEGKRRSDLTEACLKVVQAGTDPLRRHLTGQCLQGQAGGLRQGTQFASENSGVAVIPTTVRKLPVQEQLFRLDRATVIYFTDGLQSQKSEGGRLHPGIGSLYPGPTPQGGIIGDWRIFFFLPMQARGLGEEPDSPFPSFRQDSEPCQARTAREVGQKASGCSGDRATRPSFCWFSASRFRHRSGTPLSVDPFPRAMIAQAVASGRNPAAGCSANPPSGISLPAISLCSVLTIDTSPVILSPLGKLAIPGVYWLDAFSSLLSLSRFSLAAA